MSGRRKVVAEGEEKRRKKRKNKTKEIRLKI
jgi:hypothetical protein